MFHVLRLCYRKCCNMILKNVSLPKRQWSTRTLTKLNRTTARELDCFRVIIERVLFRGFSGNFFLQSPQFPPSFTEIWAKNESVRVSRDTENEFRGKNSHFDKILEPQKTLKIKNNELQINTHSCSLIMAEAQSPRKSSPRNHKLLELMPVKPVVLYCVF